jgi:sulfate/thiosulfate transport system substrate-binding protein
LELVTIDKEFGGWKNVSKKYFGDGGIFDAIYQPAGAPR